MRNFLLVPDKEQPEAGPVSEKFGLLVPATTISHMRTDSGSA